MDFYAFYTGQEPEAYRFLGAHPASTGFYFRTFAPAASRIAVIGDFNGWQETPMHRIHDGNFWECEISQASVGMRYKYRIYKQDNSCTDHCDPYGFFMEKRPQSASIVWDPASLSEEDHQAAVSFQTHKGKNALWDQPLNIYELHFGSWRRKPKSQPNSSITSEEDGGWYSYQELADLLIPYLKENGYNCLEIMPLAEHPSDESWGYQITGFFSPTSRYGTPEELSHFIAACHRNGIGVIMDFVPVHFAVDDYGLWNFDGTALYEYPHKDVGNSEWGSCNFMHSRGEVRSFLQSAACYWLGEFHFDGLRLDAVSNLIYWQGNPNRGENRGAIQFLRDFNSNLKQRFPAALLIAEDSSSYPGVTRPVWEGGLGFDYKWDLGFMNDTLSYFQSPPWQRVEKYHKLTFSMMYFYNEKYILPFSHDEVVHGKATILQKMHGEYEQKFDQARAMYLYMYAHPGKKLNFMGNELGQLREWDEKREQDWDILTYPRHDAFHRFMRELNQIYLKTPALSALDYEPQGFLWLDCHAEARCVYAWERRAGEQRILAVFNFSDEEYKNYQLTIPAAFTAEKEHAAAPCRLLLLIASDRDCYGGTLPLSPDNPETAVPLTNGQAVLGLSPYCGRYYRIEE